MADRYWVGGAGTWDATTTTNWSDTSGGTGGFSAPTSVDNVIFDSSSNVGNYSVTIGLAATPATCADLSISFPLLGVVTIISAATSVINVHGSLLIQSSTVFTTTSGAVLNFLAITTGKTVLTNNVILGAMTVTFNGIGGNWQLQSAFTTGSTRTTTLTNGTLDLNGYTLTTGLFACGASANTLAFGTGNINLSGVSTIFTGSTATTVTGTPLIILDNNTASARTITPGLVTEANSISFRIISGTGALGLTAGSYRNLDFTDGTSSTGFGGSITNTAITIYGNYKASTSGMSLVGGNGTLTFTGAVVGTRTITTAGVTFDRSFTFNSTATVATDVVFQLLDNLTSGDTRTCTLTAGTLDLNNYTLTTGLFNSNNANARTIAFGSGNITVTGVSGNVFAGPTSLNIGLTTTGTAQVNVTGSGTGRTVNPGNPAAITGFISFTISNGSDTITSTSGMTFNNLTFTSGFTGIFDNVSRNIFGNLTLNAAINSFSSGAAVTTFNGTGSRTITSAGETIDCPITFNGIGGTFACQDALTLGSTQPLTMTNGTLQLKSGTTSTVGSFVTSGTNQKFLQATTPGSQATLSDASGTNSVSYLTIQDSNATGGATFNAIDPTNVNAGNNTGWIFRNPTGGSGNGTRFGFGFRI